MQLCIDLFDQIGGLAEFIKIDLQSNYHQLRIQDEDVPKIAFRAWYRHYKFLVIPFGLTNPLTRLNRVFHLYVDQFVIVCVDDILIYLRSKEEHETHFRIALQTLQEHCLYAKLSKCKFWLFEVIFLRHVVSAARIMVDLAKVEAIFEMRVTYHTTEIWSFL